MAANDDPFDNFQFIPPPEAPVFEPTEEEFADPLAYIAKIRPIAVKTGICKIRPPKDWKPPFAVDIDKFRFTPRVQRLYELEAQSRIKLNFICNLAQFNRLQGKEKFRVPNLFGRHLDLYKLHKLVSNYGGYEIVTNQRKWNLIAEKMSYPQPNKAGLALKGNYERVLLPYVLTMGGFNHDPQVVKQLFPIKPLKCRESMDGVICQTAKKRKRDSLDGSNQVSTLSDYDSNRELKKLQFFGPGPKAAVPTTSGDEGPKLESSTSVSIPVPNPPSSEERKPVRRTPPQHGITRPIVNEIDNIVCSACCRGDDEDVLLICGTKACDKSYHTYCLVPPLSSLPKEEWCCPVCVQKTCSQPPEEFGFPQSQTTYSLAEFGHKADLFKSAYFQRECYQVPYREVEREFWRVLQAFNEDVVV
jgi:[histone H3]-trimethyl-L-lysine4 demethylase